MKGFKELLEECKEFVADDPVYYGLELSTKEVRLVVEALEKQIPKKPKKLSYEPLIRHGWEYECPQCGKAIGINSVGFDFTDEYPFCPSCGQKIDWSDK